MSTLISRREALISISSSLLAVACGGGSGQTDTRLSAAIQSMSQAHEATPHGLPASSGWQSGAQVPMGCYPHSDYVPTGWPGDLTRFLGPWLGIVNWFVICRIADNSGNDMDLSVNTGVRIGKMRLWLLSKTTMKWIQVDISQPPTWASSMAENLSGESFPTTPIMASGTEGVLYLSPHGQVTHGGTARYRIPLAWNDIAAVLSTTDHRLERIDPNVADDTALAKFVVLSGVDYYPDMTTPAPDVGPYIPGAGLGRFLCATKQWRTSVMFAKANEISEGAVLAAGWPSGG